MEQVEWTSTCIQKTFLFNIKQFFFSIYKGMYCIVCRKPQKAESELLLSSRPQKWLTSMILFPIIFTVKTVGDKNESVDKVTLLMLQLDNYFFNKTLNLCRKPHGCMHTQTHYQIDEEVRNMIHYKNGSRYGKGRRNDMPSHCKTT